MRTAAYDITDPDFVSANRYGQLAPKQIEVLKSTYYWPGLLYIGLGLGIAACMVLMFGGMALSLLSEGDDEWWISLIVMVFPALIGGGLVLGGARQLWIWFRINATGSLATGEGRLVWRRNNYRGVVDGPELGLPVAAELPPGPYRFFYVAGANLILSAEPLKLTLDPHESRAELARALQEALDFTPDDLAANQTLQLSGRQRTNLIMGTLGLAVLLSVLFLFPIVMFLGFVVSEGGFGVVDSSDMMPFLCFGGIMLIVDGVILLTIIAGAREAFAGRVESITGHLDETSEVRGSGKSRRTYYYYVIDGQKFQVTPAAHKASIENLRYRLFYLPRSKKVVSIEPIPDPHLSSPFDRP
ncbi:MAG TPA: hypothetical protein PLC98_08245 [Anaerolineales bacterium]|nr:hypothetical protein [Anaerolineales bacterium]